MSIESDFTKDSQMFHTAKSESVICIIHSKKRLYLIPHNLAKFKPLSGEKFGSLHFRMAIKTRCETPLPSTGSKRVALTKRNSKHFVDSAKKSRSAQKNTLFKRQHEKGPGINRRRRRKMHRQLGAGQTNMLLHGSTEFRLVTVHGRFSALQRVLLRSLDLKPLYSVFLARSLTS